MAPRRPACSKSFVNSYNFRVILYNKRWFSLLLRSVSRTQGIFWMKPALDPLRVIYFFVLLNIVTKLLRVIWFFSVTKHSNKAAHELMQKAYMIVSFGLRIYLSRL